MGPVVLAGSVFEGFGAGAFFVFYVYRGAADDCSDALSWVVFVLATLSLATATEWARRAQVVDEKATEDVDLTSGSVKEKGR